MKQRKKLIFLLLVTLSIALAVLLLYRRYRLVPVPQNDQAYLPALTTAAQFQNFAGAPLDNAYANITSVKAVYDLRRKQIYYINSAFYRLHYDFCSRVLGYRLGLALFNIANYGSRRDFYLANINYLKKSDQYVLEFGPYDEIDSLQITDMYAQVSRSAFMNGRLRLLLNTTNTLRYFAGQQKIPTCDITTLNEGLSYQMIQAGSCTGRLVLCSDVKARYLAIKPGDILVVKGTPVDVPVCKAIISDCFQTPLSHIQVLSHNKKMPSAYLKNSFTNEAMMRYDGKMVRLVVTPDTVLVTPAAFSETIATPARQVTLALHTNLKTIIPIEKCGGLTNADIGTKARGLADLKEIADREKNIFSIPEGAFVIPFYFYRQHVQQANIESLLAALRACDAGQTEKINDLLARIRTAIIRTPLSNALLQQVYAQINQNNCGTSYRFRSSGNAEDLQGFSGAGLYDSKTGRLNGSKKTIEKAIKKVWASMYNYRAYQERLLANMDESTVGMSILAHRSFPHEDINGVIITKNSYRADYPGIVVNAQQGDISTVSPPDSVTCEQLILTENKLMNPFSKKVAAKYICYSSLHPSGPLLSYAQLLQLQQSASAITSYYAAKNRNWDLEFKFDAGKLYIKQVRPYN